MESSDSFTSSSSISSQYAAYPQIQIEENRGRTSSSSFYSSLHEIRRAPLKPMKKPIAPLPPTKPKVYKVDSINFKQVVQRLTAAPEFQPIVEQGSEVDVVETLPPGPAFRQRRLEEVAPPALDLSNTTPPLRFSSTANDVAAATVVLQQPQEGEQFQNFLYGTTATQIPASTFSEFVTSERKLTCGAQSPLGFSFSPSSLAWCLSPLLSPGTLSFLD